MGPLKIDKVDTSRGRAYLVLSTGVVQRVFRKGDPVQPFALAFQPGCSNERIARRNRFK